MMEAATTVAPAPVHDAMPILHGARTRASQMPQHMQALAHANEIRLARAALKRSVKAGQLSAAEIVRTCPLEVETMTVSELLCSQRRWGRARARKFLSPMAVNENRELGRLTERQRGEMARRLEQRATVRAGVAASGVTAL
jgi:hypothetical protein